MNTPNFHSEKARARRTLSGVLAMLLVLSFSGCKEKTKAGNETKKRVKVTEETESETSKTSGSETETETETTGTTTTVPDTTTLPGDLADMSFDRIDFDDLEAEILTLTNPQKLSEEEFFDSFDYYSSYNAYCIDDKYLDGEPFDMYVWFYDEDADNISKSLNYAFMEDQNLACVEYNQFINESALHTAVEETWESAYELKEEIKKDPKNFAGVEIFIGENFIYYSMPVGASIELYLCGDCLLVLGRMGDYTTPDILNVLKHDLGLPDMEMTGGYVSPTPTTTPTPTPSPMPMPDDKITEEAFLKVGIEAFDAEEVDEAAITQDARIGSDFSEYCVADHYVETYHGCSLSQTSYTDQVVYEIIFVCDTDLNGVPVELAAGYYAFDSEAAAKDTMEEMKNEAEKYPMTVGGTSCRVIADDYYYYMDGDVLLAAAYRQGNVIISLGGVFNHAMPTPLKNLVTELGLPWMS